MEGPSIKFSYKIPPLSALCFYANEMSFWDCKPVPDGLMLIVCVFLATHFLHKKVLKFKLYIF